MRGSGGTKGRRVRHAVKRLPHVTVDSNNLTICDSEGFIGDQANGRAFVDILDDVRQRMRKGDCDPLGHVPTDEIDRDKLGRILLQGDVEAAGAILTAIEEFAQSLTAVIRRFMKEKHWRGTERIAIGGGMRASRVGELALARSAALLKLDGLMVKLDPIDQDPDEAGLLGTAWLWDPAMLAGHTHLLAVDIGGSNIRAGIVALGDIAGDRTDRLRVWRMELWKHSEEEPGREETMDELVAMLKRLIRKAEKKGRDLAPLIGVGCPGMIRPDGAIVDGGHNLPGDWESEAFRLPARLREAIPTIGGRNVTVLLHNDAVVQGLSQLPGMGDVKRWGVLTIGTGLGNARFTNRGVAS